MIDKKLFTIPPQFKALNDSKIRTIIERSGRSSGKSTTNETVAILRMFERPDNDIWYCRAEKGDIQQSIFQSFQATAEMLGVYKYFHFSKSPFQAINTQTGAVCYFGGINGKTASDLESTKGFTPKHKRLAMFILDEANEVKSPMHIDASENTASKFLAEDGKIVYAYNPPPVLTHWANTYFTRKERSENAVSIYTTYEDIYGLLKPATISMIEEMKVNSPDEFEYWYLGKQKSLQGLVLFTFTEQNLMTLDDFLEKTNSMQSIYGAGMVSYEPVYMIYGVDSGHSHDPTAVCCWAIMPDSTAIKLETFYYDFRREKQGMTNSQQAIMIHQSYEEFRQKWEDLGVILPDPENEIWIFDNAPITDDLRMQFIVETGFKCIPVENKHIDRDLARLRDDYYRRVALVLDIPENYESIRETRSFVYGENGKIPEGQDDHTIDADKYASSIFYKVHEFL